MIIEKMFILGYSFNVVTISSKYCLDIDECLNPYVVCGVDSECQNSLGSYRCVCKPGFKPRPTIGSSSQSDSGIILSYYIVLILLLMPLFMVIYLLIMLALFQVKFTDPRVSTLMNVQWEFVSKGAPIYGVHFVVIADLDIDLHLMVS